MGQLFEGFRRYLKLLAELQIDKKHQAKLDPSDVVQETFLAAHRDFAMFRGTTERELARNWYDKAVEWMDKNAPYHEELLGFRGECEALMGLDEAPLPEFEAEGDSGQPAAGSGQE